MGSLFFPRKAAGRLLLHTVCLRGLAQRLQGPLTVSIAPSRLAQSRCPTFSNTLSLSFFFL